MQTPLVVPPLGGIVPVNFRLKPVLQTATQTYFHEAVILLAVLALATVAQRA